MCAANACNFDDVITHERRGGDHAFRFLLSVLKERWGFARDFRASLTISRSKKGGFIIFGLSGRESRNERGQVSSSLATVFNHAAYFPSSKVF